ncbi:MAG TPA: hypothetical protein VIZ43_21525 [Trebonia sp.]
MSDLLFIVILVAFFVLAIGLVQVLSRMIERSTDSDPGIDEPDTEDGFPRPGTRGQAGPR